MDLLTVIEAAAALKTSKFTVRKLIKSGALQAFKVGDTYRVDAADLRHYVEQNRVAARGVR